MNENDDTQPRTYLLTGKDLEMGKAVIRACKKRDALLAELQEQQHRVLLEHAAEVDAVWKNLSKSLGIDDEKSVTIDANYFVEHGLLFLLEVTNPIEAAMKDAISAAVHKKMN